MVKLLLIADDFTGALDTGVQFAGQGAQTKIVIGKEAECLQLEREDADVIVVDAETRHLPHDEAYRMVVKLAAKALKEKVPHIFKKTDSALRGNIGMELAALLEVSGENFLPFIPALPAMNRVTRKGIHYIEGVPIAETVFGRDPFEPVTSSDIKDLFRDTKVNVQVIEKKMGYEADSKEPTIGIFDAETAEDIERVAGDLKSQGKLRIIAGCAGVASVLPGLLDLTTGKNEKLLVKKPLLVVCGSLNPISQRQIEYGVKCGFPRYIIDKALQTEDGYFDTKEGQKWIASIKEELCRSPLVMIYTGTSKDKRLEDESVRIKIADIFGMVVKKLVNSDACNTVLVTGGDTLFGLVEQMGCKEINLVGEIRPGTVLSSMRMEQKDIWVLSKSGGFGDEKLLVEVAGELI